MVERYNIPPPMVHGPIERLKIGRSSPGDVLFNTRSGNITIGNNVVFGHKVMVLTGFHDYHRRGSISSRVTIEDAKRDIIIEDGVWIASGSIILGPVKIGKDAVIGAGSVVMNDVPPETLVAGNPAKIIKKIEFKD